MKLNTTTTYIATLLFLPFFWSPPQGGSFPLYSPSWTLLTLHLLIIWVATWVLVPSDIPTDLLCVVVAKATLFRGLLHINAVKVLIVEHLMERQQLFLELLYRHAPVCLPAVLISLFGRLWEIALVGKSLFFYLGLG